VKIRNHHIHPALLIVDMQNGFVSKGGSYDLMGLNVSKYAEVVPTLKRLIDYCRRVKIPIFYSQAVREESGIDLLTISQEKKELKNDQFASEEAGMLKLLMI
jgi:nicotinamidase-related amidase